LHADEKATHLPRGRILRDLAIVSTACLLLLLPFINKPLSSDDPPYVWVARQISGHPLDFYGFSANWNGTNRPISEYDENPPLGSYFITLLGKLSGWNFRWIHAGFFLLALMAAVGVYLLANEFCEKPLAAVLLFLICPAFLVSATSLMYDVPMLAFWTWTIFFWIRGSRVSLWMFPAAGICLATAILTKYTALNLLPLLLAHMVIYRGGWKRRAAQMVSLLIPIAALAAFEWFTVIHYGQLSLVGAAHFSLSESNRLPVSLTLRTLDALAYLGGSALAAALVGLVALGRVAILIFTGGAALLALASHVLVHHANGWLEFASIARAAGIAAVSNGRPVWGFDAQFGFLAAAGAAVFVASVLLVLRSGHGRKRRDGLFLILWIGGVFVFAGCLNWTINTRTMLPLVPAVCIVAMRILDLRRAKKTGALPLLLTAVAAGLMAIFVVFGDYQIAVANRNAAVALARRGPRVWFSGHMGFQYYMQENGALPLDEVSTVLRGGDLLIVPLNNDGAPHLDGMVLVGKLEVDPGISVTTLSNPLGANFFGSDGNQLPFVIGAVPPEPFAIFRSLADNRR
jgi:4-amino-4-deoxy-L-arabinose transferase-like glycosyltransferase